MRVGPPGARVVQESVTAGGLLMTSDVAPQERTAQGTVVAVGDLEGVAVGDVVMYSKLAGLEVVLEDKPYVLLQDIDVMGVLA